MSSIREIALARAIGGGGGGEISVQSLSVTETVPSAMQTVSVCPAPVTCSVRGTDSG